MAAQLLLSIYMLVWSLLINNSNNTHLGFYVAPSPAGAQPARQTEQHSHYGGILSSVLANLFVKFLFFIYIIMAGALESIP